MKKALIFDPYVETLGGGERYALTVAETLLNAHWQVTLAWTDETIVKKAADRFGLNLDSLKTSPELFHLFTNQQNLLSRYQATKDLDLIFYVSDGSIPVLFSRHNLLHYQVPFTHINRSPLVNQLKLLSIHHIVVNSRFTQDVIDKTLGIRKSQILYPPVATDIFKPDTNKDNLILNVGRFVSPSHPKRQDVLIDAFRQLNQPKWKLVLAGGHKGDSQNLESLQRQANGLNVEFVINPDYRQLIDLYNHAKIYWHGAGYEVDETINPEAVEHFGITTVEAMAAGCVPVVIGKGGQKEIVDIDSGFLCNTPQEIAHNTKTLIDNPDMLKTYSQQSQLRAQNFSKTIFSSQLLHLVAR